MADGRHEHGFVTVTTIAAAAFGLVLLTLLVNLVVVQFGRAVVRTALDEGARDAARTLTASPERACVGRAEEVRDAALGAGLAAGVRIVCSADGDAIVARADITWSSWLPAMPPFRLREKTVAYVEIPEDYR